MYGFILAVGMWLFVDYLEMPVSTTHSCVGGMIGMAMVLKGPSCVIWYKPVETFPYWWYWWNCNVVVFITCFLRTYCNVCFFTYKMFSFKKRI